MEEVCIHAADLDTKKEEDGDTKKVETTDSRRNIIRVGACFFIWTVIICVTLVFVSSK